jgi:hypothetical protein
MKFLFDSSKSKHDADSFPPELFGGQLITPLTSYSRWSDVFAIDNGAFSRFDEYNFNRLLKREINNIDNCLFVTIPDIVGSARRTNEVFKRLRHKYRPWKVAYVAQDGAEDLEIPWDDFDCLFLGGGDPWKDSQEAISIVKCAKILKKHVHIGRVNAFDRWERFLNLGADTCDGSGVSRYPKVQLAKILEKARKKNLI